LNVFGNRFYDLNPCISSYLESTKSIQKILRKGGKNTQQSFTKKILNDPDKDYGVITHLEPDILEYKVKWALGSITMNKGKRGHGIPA